SRKLPMVWRLLRGCVVPTPADWSLQIIKCNSIDCDDASSSRWSALWRSRGRRWRVTATAAPSRAAALDVILAPSTGVTHHAAELAFCRKHPSQLIFG